MNAAGVAHGEPVASHDEASWRHVLDVNLTGPFHVTREILAGMMERGFGRIVNISSGSGVRVGAGSGASAARSSNIANPMGLVLQPEDIAHAVAFLCHPSSPAITGQVLYVNGGSLVP